MGRGRRRHARKSRSLNESDLEQLLDAYQFETHSIEDYSLAKQARLIREAAIVFAVQGAGLANLLFARPETRVAEIVPAGRYNETCFPKKSCVIGLRHEIIFAERVGRPQLLRVDVNDVAAAIEGASGSVSRQAAA